MSATPWIPENWTFHDKEVAGHFDAHVREQLPWYDLVTGSVVHIVRNFLPQKGLMYDLGCSTGNIARGCADVLAQRGAAYIGIEESPQMLEHFAGPGQTVCSDVCTYDYAQFDVAVLFLVLMFVPVVKRPALMKNLVEHLLPGGAIIIVDKLEPRDGYLGKVFDRMTLDAKLSALVDPQEIIDKELSLSGVQIPLRPLRDLPYGDTASVPWFQFGDFVGYVIRK